MTRSSKVTLLVVSGTLLFMLAIFLIGRIAFIGDPVAGGYGRQNSEIGLLAALSVFFGSFSFFLFSRILRIYSILPNRSSAKLVVTGFVQIAASLLLYYLAFVVRKSDILLLSLPVSLLLMYAGCACLIAWIIRVLGRNFR